MNRLDIEWRHLDKEGKTCTRCSDTGENLKQVMETLADELEALGWEVVFRETKLTEEEIGDSNMILLNGIPIENLLRGARSSENCCASCGELLGAPTLCRTIEFGGRAYEAIPASFIRDAALTLVHSQNKNTLKGANRMDIKVLGPGCPRCKQTEKIVKEAVAEAGADASVEKVTDVMEIAGYGVFGTPAVVVDGEVKSVGKVPDKEDVKSWLAK